MLRNIRLPGTGGARPDSSQGENRPPSARASVVDRLRKMTLSGGSQPSRTTSGAAATRASPALGSRGVNGVSAAGPRTGGVSPPTVPRPPSSGAMSSAAANGVGRRTPTKELGHSSAHATSASGGNVSPTQPRSGKSSPTPGMKITEPTGGLRSGASSPPPRSPGKRDISPVKTHKNIAARPTGSVSPPFHGLKVGITLMTRKPHRFDWYAAQEHAPERTPVAAGHLGQAAPRFSAAPAARPRESTPFRLSSHTCTPPPLSLHTHRWLRYHRSMGVYHVFVHVEDTPELIPLLQSEEFADFVTVTTGNDKSEDIYNPTSNDNYYTLMQRQERQVRRSVSESRSMGIDWLFHVDDDELLYFDTPFSRIVDGLAPGVTCIVLVNIEAVPKSLSSECVFEDIEVFTQHKMLAYRNGKSAGRVPDSDWHGPHRFTGSYHVVPVSRACVLHFESCLYEQWRNKFIKHREIDEQKKKDIPFPFYRDSISLFQKDHDGGKDEERWKQFFKDRKIGNFSDLTESQKTRLALSTSMPQMINATA